MRFALRNQEKLKTHFGERAVAVMMAALKDAAGKHKDISELSLISCKPYPFFVLPVTDCQVKNIAFYVVKNMYDVYVVAFKEYK